MSSRRYDTALDDLFRQALAPTGVDAPPRDAWDRIRRAINRSQRNVWEVALAWLLPPRGYSAAWRRLTSWAHVVMAYPPLSGSMMVRGVNGGIRPTSFAGIGSAQILNLRLAS